MLSDFLADSPIYQETIETGKMQAFSSMQQELKEELLLLIRTDFPGLEELANQCANNITNRKTFMHLLARIGPGLSEQEVRAMLESSLKAS